VEGGFDFLGEREGGICAVERVDENFAQMFAGGGGHGGAPEKGMKRLVKEESLGPG
jgi:hypothetical protein